MAMLSPPVGEAALHARLRALLEAPRERLDLHAVATVPPPRRVVAVDGSSTVLSDAGAFVLGAWRAATVRLEAGRPVAAPDAVAEVDLLEDVASLHAARLLAELGAAHDSLAWLDEGDLLLLDGALQARPEAPALGALLAEATRRGVDVVGVCKSTSLMVGGVPALAACLLAARHHGMPTWWTRLRAPPNVDAQVVVARLSPAEPRAFRLDVRARDVDAAVGKVASLCGHPANPGYPGPLARVHQAALLDEGTRRALLARVRDGALRAGVAPEAWENTFGDYHDVLDLGA